MSKINDQQLSAAINRWEKTAPIHLLLDNHALRKHMLDKFGIKMGTLYEKPEVVDEKKYVLFLLSFST